MSTDVQRPLAIAYLVYAVIVAMGAFALGIFLALVANAALDGTTRGDGDFIVVVLVAVEVFLLAKVAIVLLAAHGLWKGRRFGWCIAAACVSLPGLPLGTALGIWSLIVLTQPSMRARFAR